MDKDYDAEIAHADQRLVELKPQMEAALSAWLDVTAPWAADFWDETVQAIVSRNPDVVMALSEDGRRSIKAEAAALSAKARVHLQRRLVEERQKDWPHLRPVNLDAIGHVATPFAPNRYARDSGVFVPTELGATLNSVLADLGPIFEPHGFKTYPLSKSETAHYSGSHWWLSSKEAPEWTVEMSDRIKAYGALHQQWIDALVMKRDTIKEKTENTAANLWDQA